MRSLPAWFEDETAGAASRVASLDVDVFQEITDNALQGIMIHRFHVPFYVNRAWADLHGMTVGEVMALPTLLNLIHDSEIERLRGYAADRLKGSDPPVRYRYRALHRSGRTIWLEQFVRVVDWKGERFLQSTVIDVDDQERKEDAFRRQRQSMEEEARQRAHALTQSNRRLHAYQSIIDQMSERIILVGTDYCYRMCNRANAEFRGVSEDDLIGVHVQAMIGESWFEEHGKDLLDRAFAGYRERSERVEHGADGRRYHVEISIEPFRHSDGTISGAIVSIRDITSTKEAEERLRLFKSLIEQVSDRISVIDLDYRFRLTNKANVDFHRCCRDDFVGRPLADLVGDRDFRNFVKPDLDRCFSGETVKVRRLGKTLQGQKRVFDVVLEPYRETDGTITGAVSIARDVTEAHRLSERLAYQARYDQLTGLVNRRAFEQHLDMSIKETCTGGRSDVLGFIDLDQFKIVNDTVGHMMGDQLLQQVATLLGGKLHEGDVLARLGGDEFGLLLHGCSIRRAKRVAENLIAALNSFQFFHEGLMFEVGASIGLTAVNRHVTVSSDVMAQADLACYAAKENGRNCVQIFQKRDAVMRRRREDMYRAGGIRAALDSERFVLFCQPIAPIDDHGCGGRHVEVLLRMQGENGQLIMPSAFIPAAERYGFMAEVDRWVIQKTIGRLVQHSPSQPTVSVSINLSGVTLNDETSLEFIRRTMTFSKVSPRQICFEITETAAIRNITKTQAFIDELRGWGCRFALDDFGSGLSSLSYLKRLPVDFLKIDGSFIRDVGKDGSSHVMVRAIGQMAKDLGIQTVAEGVEDMPTLDALKGLGIDFVQGYAIGRPVPLYEAARSSSC